MFYFTTEGLEWHRTFVTIATNTCSFGNLFLTCYSDYESFFSAKKSSTYFPTLAFSDYSFALSEFRSIARIVFPQKIFSTVMSFEATSYHSIFPKNFQLGFQKSGKLHCQDFFAAAKHFSVIVGVKIVNSCMLLMVHTLVSQSTQRRFVTWFSLSPTPDKPPFLMKNFLIRNKFCSAQVTPWFF